MIKPGHTSLNMEDISEDLHVVHRHVVKLPVSREQSGIQVTLREDGDLDKPVLPAFRKEITKADDTDLVSGTPADQIAIAIDKNHRDTVNNTLNFNGRPADDFVSKSEGNTLVRKTDNIINHLGKTLFDVHDELYQLKHELEKKGIVVNTNQHFGYNDIFLNGYKPYEHESLGYLTEDCTDNLTIKLVDSSVDKLDDGDWIALYYHDAAKVDVRQIRRIMPDGETLILDEGLTSVYNKAADNVEVFKSFGVSQDGNYYMARKTAVVIGDTTFWTGFDDDTSYKYRRPVTANDSSYAYSFRIPEEKLGFLTKFSILARSVGTPTLTCYIFDAQDIPYFKNPVNAKKLFDNEDVDSNGERKMHFFAKSKPVQMDPSKGSHLIEFDFFDANLDSYPLMHRKDSVNYRVRYVAIIVGTYVDANNYAEIEFLQDMNAAASGLASADIQKNNTVYYYDEQPESSTIPAISTDASLNTSDMYYSIELKEAIDSSFEIIPRGLYTAHMETSYPQGISAVRLMMRIGREGGDWRVNSGERQVYGSNTNSTMTVECNPAGKMRDISPLNIASPIRKPLELRANDGDKAMIPDLIIGNDITKGNGFDLSITPDDIIVADPGDFVYRNGYVISVKGKLYEYDSNTEQMVVTDQKKIFLKPVAVIKDGIKAKGDIYSDRIIWEGNFTDDEGKPEFYNDLELQIYWEQNNFSNSEEIKQTQIGVIHDLVFTTEETAGNTVGMSTSISGSKDTFASLRKQLDELKAELERERKAKEASDANRFDKLEDLINKKVMEKLEEVAAIKSLPGPKGEKGDKGDPGLLRYYLDMFTDGEFEGPPTPQPEDTWYEEFEFPEARNEINLMEVLPRHRAMQLNEKVALGLNLDGKNRLIRLFYLGTKDNRVSTPIEIPFSEDVVSWNEDLITAQEYEGFSRADNTVWSNFYCDGRTLSINKANDPVILRIEKLDQPYSDPNVGSTSSGPSSFLTTFSLGAGS